MAKTNEINDILSQGNAISKVMTGGYCMAEDLQMESL